MVKNDLVVIIGTILSLDDKAFLNELSSTKIALISVLEDTPIMDRVSFFSRYEAGSEEGVIAILAKELLKDKDLPLEYKHYFDELDEGYISAETNIGEEEIEELLMMLQDAKNPMVVFGKDLFLNPRVENISKFINLISKYSGLETKCLENLEQSKTIKLEEVEELESFDGTIVFQYNSNEDTNLLFGSVQFGVAAKIQDGQKIEVKNEQREFVLDKKLKGTIALMPSEKVDNSYRYKVTKITKREVQ
jgi:NADH-quinone oxidoreductase subunit F